MKRFTHITLAIIVFATSFTPVTAEAGIFRRLFGRRDRAPVVRYYYETEDGYRRYSYEPGMQPSSGTRVYYREEEDKPAYLYPKTDPRRYRP